MIMATDAEREQDMMDFPPGGGTLSFAAVGVVRKYWKRG
jgi:hypothetical protein